MALHIKLIGWINIYSFSNAASHTFCMIYGAHILSAGAQWEYIHINRSLCDSPPSRRMHAVALSTLHDSHGGDYSPKVITTLHNIGADVCQTNRSSNLQHKGGRALLVCHNSSASVTFELLTQNCTYIPLATTTAAREAHTIMYRLYGWVVDTRRIAFAVTF